jgi:hypothetical protein
LRRLYRLFVRATIVPLAALAGCAHSNAPADFRPSARPATTSPTTLPTAPLQTFSTFSAHANPPEGWTLSTTSVDDRHEHMTWVSPSGDTAVGVIYFKLPWPVGHEIAFRYGFLPEMRRGEGEAEVLEKNWDPAIEGLRFVVNSRNFRVSSKFLVRGLRGFATYSGTKRALPVNEVEERQAIEVRETLEFAGEVSTTQPTQK